jgi:ABC-type antimicrobial peptide transport system permease subunit
VALGATRGDVVRLVVRSALALVAIGLLVGLPLTFAAGRFLGTQLYGSSPDNPAAIVAAVLALAVSGLVAACIPALRASTVSPLTALRSE